MTLHILLTTLAVSLGAGLATTVLLTIHKATRHEKHESYRDFAKEFLWMWGVFSTAAFATLIGLELAMKALDI